LLADQVFRGMKDGGFGDSMTWRVVYPRLHGASGKFAPRRPTKNRRGFKAIEIKRVFLRTLLS
jgi:hypothetical protein